MIEMGDLGEELEERMVKLAEAASNGEVICAQFGNQIVTELMDLLLQNAEASRCFAKHVRRRFSELEG